MIDNNYYILLPLYYRTKVFLFEFHYIINTFLHIYDISTKLLACYEKNLTSLLFQFLNFQIPPQNPLPPSCSIHNEWALTVQPIMIENFNFTSVAGFIYGIS